MKGSKALEVVSESCMNCVGQDIVLIQSEERTFINEGNKSLCVKYERRLVWYAPDVIDRANSTAF